MDRQTEEETNGFSLDEGKPKKEKKLPPPFFRKGKNFSFFNVM